MHSRNISNANTKQCFLHIFVINEKQFLKMNLVEIIDFFSVGMCIYIYTSTFLSESILIRAVTNIT